MGGKYAVIACFKCGQQDASQRIVSSGREEERGNYLESASASIFTMMEVDDKESSLLIMERGYQQESWWFPLGGVM